MIRNDHAARLGEEEATWAGERLGALRSRISESVVGSDRAAEMLIACLLAGGHALLEDVPGVGKTLLASTLAKSIDASFSRIQLTPDMLPADVLGVSVYEPRGEGGGPDHETPSHHAMAAQVGGRFRFVPGPLFANIVLADEVNRTTPRTQSAMLEAMNEGTVSIDGVTHELERPFMVIATQNPFEFEGTYPLPENQLDRFLMRLSLGYPGPEDEARILAMNASGASGASTPVKPALNREEVVRLQGMAARVWMDDSLERYIVAIAQETRDSADLYLGMSPRGSLALARASRALALLRGREYVIPEDVVDCAPDVVGHRVIPRGMEDGRLSGISADAVRALIEGVRSPV